MALEYLTWWLMSQGVACFLFLNVLVAAIAVTSRSGAQLQQGHGGGRAASSMVLDRLLSFSAATFSYDVSPEAEELKRQVSRGAAAAPSPHHQLAVPPEPGAMAAIPKSANASEDEKAAAGAVKSLSSDVNGHGHAQESMPSPPSPAPAPAVAVVTVDQTAKVAALARGQPKEEPPATVAEVVERKHRAHVYALEGKAELNAQAEQFIRQFRQDLRLQRLDSMLRRRRHTNHTLTTGSGEPTGRRW